MVTKNPSFQLLLCTNGCAQTRPSLQYGLWLSSLLQAQVTLLGVIESAEEEAQVEALVAETVAQLTESGIPHSVEFAHGRGSDVIAAQAQSAPYLTVAGPLGRPAWRRVVQGRSFRRLLAKIESPLLYVPVARLPLVHILLCMGGLGYAESAKRLVIHMARATGARITILHVVEPVSLRYPLAEEVQANWEHILETGTPQATNLRRSLEEVREAGLQVEFKVRHGGAVNEILEEVRHGEYDLIGMGSTHSSQSLRHLYLPNVTAEVAETARLPVLTVRQGFELV